MSVLIIPSSAQPDEALLHDLEAGREMATHPTLGEVLVAGRDRFHDSLVGLVGLRRDLRKRSAVRGFGFDVAPNEFGQHPNEECQWPATSGVGNAVVHVVEMNRAVTALTFGLDGSPQQSGL